MKRPRILFLAAGLATIHSPCFAQSLATLGMSPAEVMAVETNELNKDTTSDGTTFLVYRRKLQSLEGYTWYIFRENKLRHLEYFVKGPSDDCLTQHTIVSQSLTEKYGGPVESKEDWKNEYYKSYSEHKARAIGLGHMKVTSEWETSDLLVWVTLQAAWVPKWENNLFSLLTVHYEDKRPLNSDEKK